MDKGGGAQTSYVRDVQGGNCQLEMISLMMGIKMQIQDDDEEYQQQTGLFSFVSTNVQGLFVTQDNQNVGIGTALVWTYETCNPTRIQNAGKFPS